MPSDIASTMSSTSSRFFRYAGLAQRENRVVSSQISGVSARLAKVSPAWVRSMYTRYTPSESSMIAPCSTTPSTNERTDCTSPVTRLMMEPLALSSKKRKLSRCSLSKTRVLSSGTSFKWMSLPTAMAYE
jgi:hypothetical protein